jgi:enoyl-CoA hydratase/carnithine racemase
MMDAAEAERCGLVSRVVPLAELMSEALKAAARIAAMPPMVVRMTKEMVDAAFETPLSAGMRLERRLFHSLFGLEDQKEGMAAFVEKRKPNFKGR